MIAIVVLIGLAWRVLTQDGQLSFVPPGRAVTLLTEVERAAALPVRERAPVERDGPDGPMPEIAGRRLVIAADASTIRTRVAGACRTLGLAPAGAERRAIEPDALCDGGAEHHGDSVHLTLSCRDAGCTAYLQTQVTGI